MLEIIFYVLIAVVLYSYLFYGLFLYIACFFLSKNVVYDSIDDATLPEVTLFVAAFNEKDFIEQKIRNSFELNYPKGKLHHLWVTDGSDDGTPDIIRSKFPNIEVQHNDARNGKIGAINRGIAFVNTSIVVFCDANTYLNKDALREIVSQFIRDPKVGCVAGEKKIFSLDKDGASGAGEGIYWKYESFIKKTESRLGSTLGAAGELFAIRTELFEPVEKDTILDDFIISLRIAKKGYKVKYAPSAFASETSSVSIEEELKRKIRIASGGIQSILRLKSLLNPFYYPEISFKFISHKILRWVVAPISFVLIFLINILLVNQMSFTDMFFVLFCGQMLFYLVAFVGYILEKKKIKFKLLFVPYYIVIMNYAAFAGFFRYIRGRHSVNWIRAQRQIID